MKRKDNTTLVTTTLDKLKFFIPCRRISPTDNCNCQSRQQEDMSGLKKEARDVNLFALLFNYYQIKTVKMR